MAQPLSDLKVVEFGRFISAAFCGKLLGDNGAEVIKIEPPGAGDEARRHGPFPNDVPHPEKSGIFLNLNTNKLGITLDPRTPTGRELFFELLKQADIVVYNFLPSEMAAWGLEESSLRKLNPRLITTSVTVFGDEGPWKDYKGHAVTASAAGAMSYRIGHPERYPLATPLDRSDYWGGMNGAGASMLAVFAREITGEGQHVDISSAEVMGAIVNCTDYFSYLTNGKYNVRAGRRIRNPYPWVIMPVKDGHFSMITAQPRHWWRFVEFMGNPEWCQQPRYRDLRAMGAEYPEEVDALVEPWVSAWSKWDLWQKCRENKVPFQAVQTMEEILDSEHLEERGFWAEVDHPDAGPLKYPLSPFKASKTPAVMRRAAPRLGEHNREVFCGRLGLSPEELTGLAKAGVV